MEGSRPFRCLLLGSVRCSPHPENHARHLPLHQEGLLHARKSWFSKALIFTGKLRSHPDHSRVLPKMTAPPGWLHTPFLSARALKRRQGLMMLISFTAPSGHWRGAAIPLGTCVLPPPPCPPPVSSRLHQSEHRAVGYWRGLGFGVLSRDREVVGRC